MNLTHWDGTSFASLNVSANILPERPGPNRQASVLRRGTSPVAIAGVTTDYLPITAIFVPTVGSGLEATLSGLLGAIGFHSATERVLKGTLNDTTSVEIDAVPLTWEWGGGEDEPTTVVVTFGASDFHWRESARSTKAEQTFSAAGSYTLTNNGTAKTNPRFKIGEYTQRTTGFTTTCGWRYRMTVAIINNGTEDWVNERVTVNIGDSEALVTAAKAQADGDDLRVVLNGEMVPRQLAGWGADRATFVTFLVSLASGDSVTAEIVYGNTAATSGVSSGPGDLAQWAIGSLDQYVAADYGSDTGTATSGTTTTLTNTGEAWEPSRWIGGWCWQVDGTGAADHQAREITANTATQLTFGNRAMTSAGGAGTEYIIWMSGIAIDGGAVSSSSSSLLSDSSQNWNTDQWVGGYVVITSGTGSGATAYPITSSGVTGLTTSSTYPTLDASSRYRVYRLGYETYYVDQVDHDEDWRGLWRINKRHTRPGKVWYGHDGVPAGWSPVRRLRNADDTSMPSHLFYDVGGSNFEPFPIPDVIRAKGSDTTRENKGQADGVAIVSAWGFHAWEFDYTWQNEDRGDGSGVGKFMASLRERGTGGDQWQDIASSTTIRASLTDEASQYNALNSYDANELYIGVLPLDEVAIPTSAKPTKVARLRLNQVFRVWRTLSSSSGVAAVQVGDPSAEAAVYDLQVEIGYGASMAAATQKIVVGGPGHYTFLPASTNLCVDCEEGRFYTYANASVDGAESSVALAPWAGMVYTRDPDVEDSATLRSNPSADWMATPPGNTTVQVDEDAIGTIKIFTEWFERHIV